MNKALPHLESLDYLWNQVNIYLLNAPRWFSQWTRETCLIFTYKFGRRFKTLLNHNCEICVDLRRAFKEETAFKKQIRTAIINVLCVLDFCFIIIIILINIFIVVIILVCGISWFIIISVCPEFFGHEAYSRIAPLSMKEFLHSL